MRHGLDGLGKRHCLLTHGSAGFFVEEGRRRLFEDLLVAALDAALAFVQIPDRGSRDVIIRNRKM
jgi:hypothetical protein